MATADKSSGNEIASIFFGAFIGVFFFTATTVARQTWRIQKRIHTVANWYLIMIWTETVVNMVFALTTYLFIRGNIKPGLGYYIGAVTLWMLQTQLLLQIIANRVALIMVSKKKARFLQWGLFLVIGLVNISVYCIWIPAQMNISETYVKLNHIWERVEKSIFLCVDLGLNLYFLYLVRSRLITNGLTKYWRLFHFNACIVVLSVAMDLLLLGLLNLHNSFSYVQFAPVAYTIKLNIELTMAVLISKVVRGNSRVDNHSSSADGGVACTGPNTRTHGITTTAQPQDYFPGRDSATSQRGIIEAESGSSLSEEGRYKGEGIVKTVTMYLSENDSRDRV